MPELRYTETDRLANVIDAIQIGRKTGILSVARGTGSSREEGMIMFMNGHPIQARAGLLNNTEAVQWLSAWGPCLFAFQAAPSAPTGSSTSNGSRSLSPSPYDNKLMDLDHNTYRAPTLNGRADPLARNPSGPLAQQSPSPGVPVPYRIRPVDEALSIMKQLGFPQAHRRLFLLIDGQRTLKDLVVLMQRSPEDLFVMLDQLAQADLIRQ